MALLCLLWNKSSDKLHKKPIAKFLYSSTKENIPFELYKIIATNLQSYISAVCLFEELFNFNYNVIECFQSFGVI